MRIIAGKARGHKLKTPPGMDVRPTLDRVKESVFNILNPRLAGAVVVDLFAGTGNLGLEALSRGAEKAYFIDESKGSVEVIRYNLEKTRFTSLAQVVQADAVRGIGMLAAQQVKADLILMDPPYGKQLGDLALEAVVAHQLLAPGGIIVLEHEKTDEIRWPENLICVRRKDYGQVSISFYQLKEETP